MPPKEDNSRCYLWDTCVAIWFNVTVSRFFKSILLRSNLISMRRWLSDVWRFPWYCEKTDRKSPLLSKSWMECVGIYIIMLTIEWAVPDGQDNYQTLRSGNYSYNACLPTYLKILLRFTSCWGLPFKVMDGLHKWCGFQFGLEWRVLWRDKSHGFARFGGVVYYSKSCARMCAFVL